MIQQQASRRNGKHRGRQAVSSAAGTVGRNLERSLLIALVLSYRVDSMGRGDC